MKPIALRWMALVLAFCLIPAALAEEAGGGSGLMPEPNESALDLFAWEDTLYVVTWQKELYRQEENGWLPAGRIEDHVQRMDASENALWQLVRWEDEQDQRSGYRIDRAAIQPDGMLGEMETGCEIAWEISADDWLQCRGLVVEDGAAYVLMQDAAAYDLSVLYGVDLASGSATRLLSAPLDELIRYRNGLLLSRRFSWEEFNDQDGGKHVPQVVSVDPVAGELETVGLMTGYADGALAYDAGTDTVYFSNSSYVYSVSGDASEKVGYLIPSGMEHEGLSAAVCQGQYHVNEGGRVVSGGVDPERLPARTLRVAHVYEVEDMIFEFAKLHPDVAIELVDKLPSAPEDTILHMQSSAAADVYSCTLDTGFVTLREKKYLADLSASEALTSVVDRMDARLSAEFYRDGKLYGLPCVFNVSMDGFYPGALEKAGVPRELVPTSYEEMLTFIQTWYDDYFDDNEGMLLYEDSFDLRYDLFMKMYIAHALLCQTKGQTPTMNSPEMRGLLTKLEEIRNALNTVAPATDSMVMMGDDNALFTGYADPMPHAWIMENEPTPMILSLDHGSEPVILAYMGLLAVNPYSDNADIATELLEYIAQRLPQTLQIALMPDCNEPIPCYTEEKREADLANIEMLERQLEGAAEEERAELSTQLQMAREAHAFLEQHPWYYSPEDIAFYREHIEPHLAYPLSPIFGAACEQLQSACGRYMDGQLSMEDFIREFDRVIWMTENE